jgi:hypothetical protein
MELFEVLFGFQVGESVLTAEICQNSLDVPLVVEIGIQMATGDHLREIYHCYLSLKEFTLWELSTIKLYSLKSLWIKPFSASWYIIFMH